MLINLVGVGKFGLQQIHVAQILLFLPYLINSSVSLCHVLLLDPPVHVFLIFAPQFRESVGTSFKIPNNRLR